MQDSFYASGQVSPCCDPITAQGEGSENIAELGARLKTARESALWPAWLLNGAAANYWRIIGSPLTTSLTTSIVLQEMPRRARTVSSWRWRRLPLLTATLC
jgi:hypothetical protein